MKRWLLGSIGITCISTVCTLAKAPATQHVRTLEELDKAFAAKAATIDREHHERITAARHERLAGLRYLLDRAMDKKDLDGAIRLREEVGRAEIELKTEVAALHGKQTEKGERALLERELKGAVLEWRGETVRLQPDGIVTNDGWTSRGLVTAWKVIDRRTVLFSIEQGRHNDRYAILTFSADTKTFSALNFNGETFQASRQVRR